MLGMALHKRYSLRSSLLVEALEAGLQNQPAQGLSDVHDYMLGYHIQELLSSVYNLLKMWTYNDWAALEWGYVSVLRMDTITLLQTLHTLAQHELQHFVKLLCLIFRSQQESPEAVDPTDGAVKSCCPTCLHIAQLLEHSTRQPRGWHGLMRQSSWSGSQQRVHYAHKQGGWRYVNAVLGKYWGSPPQESDGSWPCIPVRDVIEEVANEELVRGFEIGIFNKRGVYSKIPYRGGAQWNEKFRTAI